MVTAVKGVLFDKSLLKSDEYKPFIYEISFKNRSQKDLKAEGYLRAAYPYLVGLESEIIHFGKIGSDQPGSRSPLRAVIQVTVIIGYYDENGKYHEERFQAFGDGDEREVADASALVREVETRALKRAISRAIGLGKVDINEGVLDDDEEEVGSRIKKNLSTTSRTDRIAERIRSHIDENTRSDMESEGSAPPDAW